ncbi:MAG: hypothetical protein KF683_01265 [Rubrivivax sp.]|nr:hypothetical protein [Rubrivivax sp.]
MRPRGSYGPVATALLGVWSEAPAPVREAAERAQVGYGVAKRTASRLRQCGELVVLSAGRPAVLAAAGAPRAPAADLAGVLAQWRAGRGQPRLVDPDDGLR